MNQLDIHKEINKFLQSDSESANVDVAKNLIDKNIDAKNYFFNQANEKWLNWLWGNKFLEKIKEKSNDLNKYSYQLPELRYLLKIAEKEPVNVVEIIKEVDCKKYFNPEVVDMLLRIVEIMPVEQITELTEKIKRESWPFLMRQFNFSVYGYNTIIKKLSETKKYKALLDITEAILEVRENKNRMGNKGGLIQNIDNDYFYFDNINRLELFQSLLKIHDKEYSEKALKKLLEILNKIVSQLKRKEKDVFEYNDMYYLMDVDLFDVELKDIKVASVHEGLEYLVITIKSLIEIVFKENCANKEKILNLYEELENLPENRLVFRLKLFALAQCPEILKDKIRENLDRVFEPSGRYFEIEIGAEYHHLLKKTFDKLDEDYKKEYIEKVFNYFSDKKQEKDVQEWRKRDGKKIILLIKDYLGDKKEKAKELFGIDFENDDYKPKTYDLGSHAGIVKHIAPESINDFSIKEIIKKLKTEWKPEKLKEKYKNDDSLSPRSAEGVGDEIKKDFKEHPQKYIDKLNEFYNKDIHSHYVYSLLQGFKELYQNKKDLGDDTKKLLNFIELIQSTENKDIKVEQSNSWLVNWQGVYRVTSDIILKILEPKDGVEEFQKDNRDQILKILEFLLFCNEKKEEDWSDLFTTAINTASGLAYQAFIMFIQNDGEKLRNETKYIFKQILKDKFLPTRFLIGHYLAVVYFRDKKFVKKLFPEIFPKEIEEKKDIYIATWEGYLSNTLYAELFDKLKKYYKFAIKNKIEESTNRKYFKDIDKALAVHMALAFAYLRLKQDDSLFELFWKEKNTKRHKEFISFIGKSCFEKDEIDKKWLKKNKDKMIKFWDWVIKNKNKNNIDSEVFSAFGYWINPKKEVLDDKTVIKKLATSLEISNSELVWNHAFFKRLSDFAKVNPKDTLLAIENYFFDKDDNLTKKYLIYKKELKEALEIIYKKEENSVKGLINKLIEDEKGSMNFWFLEDII